MAKEDFVRCMYFRKQALFISGSCDFHLSTRPILYIRVCTLRMFNTHVSLKWWRFLSEIGKMAGVLFVLLVLVAE